MRKRFLILAILWVLASLLVPGHVLANAVEGLECRARAWGPAGQIQVEEFRPGDTVLSRDEKTGEQAWRPVVRTYTWPGQRILNLTFTTGADELAESLSATAEHPFWTHQGWLAAADLTPGTLVFTSSGEWLRVSSAIWASERSLVHNFEVAGFHTYFVGRAELWVHNDCGPKGGGGGPKRGKRFNGEQSALVDMAKRDKKAGGVTRGDAAAYKQLGDKTGVPVRGPETHPGRPQGKNPHIHVGPVNHIPVTDG